MQPLATSSSVSEADDERLEAGFVEFMELKAASSAAASSLRDTKSETESIKNNLDEQTTELFNLEYEKANYERTIRRLQSISPLYQSIALVDEKTFFKEAPKSLTTIPSNDPHKLMLNRLAYELQERKRLCVDLDAVKAKKAKITTSNAKKKESLASLLSSLKELDDVAGPILKQMTMVPTSMGKEPSVDALPRPLYTLYQKAHAFSETEDKDTSVSLEDHDAGDATAAEERHDKVYPKAVLLKIQVASRCLELRFFFLERLKVVSVKVGWQNQSEDAGLLASIFPGDDGVESPNPANIYLLPTQTSTWESSLPGRPYRWAQWLAALTFLNPQLENTDTTSDSTISQVSFGHVVNAIKSGLSS